MRHLCLRILFLRKRQCGFLNGVKVTIKSLRSVLVYAVKILPVRPSRIYSSLSLHGAGDPSPRVVLPGTV